MKIINLLETNYFSFENFVSHKIMTLKSNFELGVHIFTKKLGTRNNVFLKAKRKMIGTVLLYGFEMIQKFWIVQNL